MGEEIYKELSIDERRKIILELLTKIGRIGFANVERLESIDTIITGTAANLEEIKEIRKRGIEVRMV